MKMHILKCNGFGMLFFLSAYGFFEFAPLLDERFDNVGISRSAQVQWSVQ